MVWQQRSPNDASSRLGLHPTSLSTQRARPTSTRHIEEAFFQGLLLSGFMVGVRTSLPLEDETET